MAWLSGAVVLALGHVDTALGCFGVVALLTAAWWYSDLWQTPPCSPPRQRQKRR